MTNNLRIEQYFSPQYGVRTYYFRPNNEVRVIAQLKGGEKGFLVLTDAQAAAEIEHLVTVNGFEKTPQPKENAMNENKVEWHDAQPGKYAIAGEYRLRTERYESNELDAGYAWRAEVMCGNRRVAHTNYVPTAYDAMDFAEKAMALDMESR